MLRDKTKRLNKYEKVFVWATIALLLFGVMGYFLGKLPGSYRDEWQICSINSIIDSLRREKYLLWLILSVASGLLIYLGATFLCKRSKKCKWLRVASTVFVILNFFITVVFVAISIDMADIHPIHEGSDQERYVSRVQEIKQMRTKSVIFGRGDPYYTDNKYLPGENSTEEYEVILEAKAEEYIDAYYVFARWRSETLLPVLSYCFGQWVVLLYWIIALFWFVGAIMGFTAVKGKRRRLLYGSCACLVGIQVLLTMLDYYGITTWSMPVVFSTADYTAMFPVVIFPLAVMLFLIQENRTKVISV